MIESVIFDLDGTLIDSMGVWEKADRIFLAERGMEPTPGLEDELRLLTCGTAAEYLIQKFSLDMTVQQVNEAFRKLMTREYLEQIPPVEGAVEFVQKLYRQGIPLCVATATARPMAEGALRRLGIWDCMEFLITCDDLQCSKHDSTIFDYCVKRMGVSKEKTVVLEDSLHSIQAAKAGGYRVIGIYEAGSEKSGDLPEIKKTCDYFVTGYEELEQIWGQL